MNRLAAN